MMKGPKRATIPYHTNTASSDVSVCVHVMPDHVCVCACDARSCVCVHVMPDHVCVHVMPDHVCVCM